MHIHLVLPGLIWPAQSLISPTTGLSLPALEYLLGKASKAFFPFSPLEHQLAALFGVNGAQTSLALLRRRGESALPAEPSDTHWLCADPVHLYFEQGQILLDSLSPEELASTPTDALIASMNEDFSEWGTFEAATPTRWYLRLSAPCTASLFPLNDVLARPLSHFLPEGDGSSIWQHLLNETQITLHNHPLNQAREQADKRSINALWFWGNGEQNITATAPLPTLQADEPLVIGLARTAGMTITPLNPAAALQTDSLIVLNDLREAAQRLDPDAWCTALLRLEHIWFSVLAEAVKNGKLRSLCITAPGDRHTLQLTLNRTSRWQFWRAPLQLAALAPATSQTD